MKELLLIIAGVAAAGLLYCWRRTGPEETPYGNPVVLPWHPDRKGGVITLALWDRSCPALRADGAPIRNARLITPTERSAIQTAMVAWNNSLKEAGVPLYVKMTTAQDADILVFGADTLADRTGRQRDSLTTRRVKEADSPHARIERASIIITRCEVCASELGRALGIMDYPRHGLMTDFPHLSLSAIRSPRTPEVKGARLLLAAYRGA